MDGSSVDHTGAIVGLLVGLIGIIGAVVAVVGKIFQIGSKVGVMERQFEQFDKLDLPQLAMTVKFLWQMMNHRAEKGIAAGGLGAFNSPLAVSDRGRRLLEDMKGQLSTFFSAHCRTVSEHEAILLIQKNFQKELEGFSNKNNIALEEAVLVAEKYARELVAEEGA